MADDKRTQQATLGCGSLILIALIVIFFSRPGIRDLEHEVKALRTEVGELKKSIDTQTQEIRVLQNKVEKAKGNE